jgi:hypothetical protein
MNPQQHGANEPEAPLMRFQRFAAGLQLLLALMASVVLPMVSVFFFIFLLFFPGKGSLMQCVLLKPRKGPLAGLF